MDKKILNAAFSFNGVRFSQSTTTGRFTAVVPPPPEFLEQGKQKMVVLCNNNIITKQGTYNISTKPMRNGRGFIVLSAVLCVDAIAIQQDGWVAQVYINGKPASLLQRNGKFAPLTFKANHYYPPEDIVTRIKEKSAFYNFGRGSEENYISHEEYVEDLCARFLEICAKLEAEYTRYMKSQYKKKATAHV